MEGIIYNNQAQAEAMILRLNNRVRGKFKGVETSWTFIKPHPTQSKVAVVIDRTVKHWDEIEEELNPNDINNIANLGPDWVPTNII